MPGTDSGAGRVSLGISGVSAWRRFLSRPDAWSGAIAAVAVVLSQLPPISSLIAGPSIALNVGPVATLSTVMIGRPQVTIHIGIENTGGQPVTVRQLNCTLKHISESFEWPMEIIHGISAQMDSPPQVPQLLGWIPIRENEVWSGWISCQSRVSGEDTAIVESLRVRMMQSQRQALDGEPVPPLGRPISASEDLIEEATQNFTQRFDLREGTYEIELAATLTRSESVARVVRHFEITSNALDLLRFATHDFGFGGGIYFQTSVGQTGVRLMSIGSAQE